ncbi:MAG TPA: SpoIVB peptidase [Firmicutes bacterium]|nr:SpoIVB peptidase [Bacillota bacterium]HOQ24678.1 SpoIVB peptidase [Bacillota bacterium]HPT68266.1 SpoIVB peptidase [Bacillota bacterium]
MKRSHRQRFFLFFTVIILVVLMPLASLVIRIYRLPALVRLRPGQEMRLSVDAPFRFYLPPSSPRGFWGLNGKSRLKSGEGGLCSTLLLKPLQEGFSKVEVRLFGLPLRRLKVDVLKLPAVHVGGHAIGVLLSEEGVVVVGHIPLKDIDGRERYPAKEAGIKAGDIILSINGRQIDHITQLEDLVQSEAGKGQPLQLRIRRGKTVRRVSLSPVRQLDAGQRLSYRMGIYVEDPAAGVGTLTFYSLTHRFFGALGHRIMGFGQRSLPVAEGGRIVLARISGLRPGVRGEPGEKMGIFTSNDDIIGEIHHNTAYGVFGRLRREPTGNYLTEPIQVALVSEVKTGPAEILTVLAGERIERFAVEIQRVFSQSRPGDKGMIIRVTDPELIRKTGGIIQGMSGSPIIQGGKLVGAVTHVFVNDPTQGYGVFAEWMLEAGKCLPQSNGRIRPAS